jgi:hypothetical protein
MFIMSLLKKSYMVVLSSYIGYYLVDKYINEKELNLQNKYKLANKLNLKNFECKIIRKKYFDWCNDKIFRNSYFIPNTDKRIAFIEYNTTKGSIGRFFVDEDYRKKTLFTQMLETVKEELKKNNIKKMYFYTDAKEIENKLEKDINIKKIYRGEYNSPLYEINIA